MADDELNSTESVQMEQTANHNPPEDEPDESEASQARVAELERLVSDKDEALSLANARISKLEQMVASLESEVAALKQSSLESEQKLAEVSNALSQAVSSYKALVIKSNPEVPADLIDGETIEAVDNSLENAKSLISKVRERLEAEIKIVKIPAGAPPRVPIDLSALSPREKIQYGIGGNK